MKRIALVLVMLLLLAGQARAAELPAELAESLPEGAGAVAGTDFQQGIIALLDTVGEQLHTLLRRGTAGIVRILLIVVLCGVGESLLQPLQEKNAFRYVTLAGTAAIVAVAAGSIDPRFYEKHYTKVDPRHFEPIVEGMYMAVNEGGTGYVAMVPGLDICGKTGTAQNPHGRDNSTFFCFAPRNNPKIAVSVYIENGGFGATVAAPIASLLTEYYLMDTIKRPDLVERIKTMQIAYPYYEKQRGK